LRLIALDLIRFFSAISVVVYHHTSRTGAEDSFGGLSALSKFGYLGVPMFFIISGYVIALSASNRSALEFAVSRFIRLYPTFWLCIMFTVAVMAITGYREYTLLQILANLTILNDYLGFDNIDIIYWTLQAELKFYACIFLLLVIGIFNRFRLWLSLWLVLTIVFLLFEQPFFMGWFISPTYSSFFIAGIAFYLIQQEGKNLFNMIVLLISLILSCVYAYSQAANYIDNPSHNEQIAVVIVIFLFYLLFYLLVTNKIRLLKRNLYLTLGGLTYPLYLIHNMAGKAIVDTYGGYLPREMTVIITVMMLLLVAWVIQAFFEKRLSTPLKSVLLKAIRSAHLNKRSGS